MKHLKKRPRKKIHRKILGDICIEASLSSKWREKLFHSKEGDIFEFSQADLMELMPKCKELRKYRLGFSVKIAPKSSAPLWMQSDDGVIFEFYANEFPVVRTQSNNNPNVI